jgi:hypothetical protein
MLHCGDAVEMPKTQLATPHLWILITEPIEETGLAVIVNITSLRPHSDKTTIIVSGEHPYITHDSVVLYADAKITDVRLIENGIAQGHDTIRLCAPCEAKLLNRIQEGIGNSPFTSEKVYNFCEERWKQK